MLYMLSSNMTDIGNHSSNITDTEIHGNDSSEKVKIKNEFNKFFK